MTEAARVRELAKRLAAQYPGRAIELRVPPWVAVQLGFGEGPSHTRGTPPNVVETDPATFLALADGTLAWDDALPTRLRISGAHATGLRAAFPLADARGSSRQAPTFQAESPAVEVGLAMPQQGERRNHLVASRSLSGT